LSYIWYSIQSLNITESIKVFYLPTDAQESCFIILKRTLKQLRHFSVLSPSSGSIRSLMMVIKLKHVGAALVQILIFFLKQFSYASVGK
jgi:hypothetical protein